MGEIEYDEMTFDELQEYMDDKANYLLQQYVDYAVVSLWLTDDDNIYYTLYTRNFHDPAEVHRQSPIYDNVEDVYHDFELLLKQIREYYVLILNNLLNA